jgi:N-acetylglutamate synthase-like GNAT family acetyltransferase
VVSLRDFELFCDVDKIVVWLAAFRQVCLAETSSPSIGQTDPDWKFSLRPATEADFPEIRALIRQVRINPTGLDWRRFTVAVDGSGQMIACAQLKPVPGGLTELASLAVRSAYRHQGIARSLIEHLLAEASRPVYLTCRSGLGKLYEKFGFRALATEDLPAYYLRLQRLAGIFMGLTRRNETLLVMKLG